MFGTSLIPAAAMTTVVQADGLFDWLNGQIADATEVIKAGVALAALIILTIVAARANFALGRTLACAAVAAIVLWLVAFNGIEVIAGLFGGQIEAGGAGLVPGIDAPATFPALSV